MLDPSVPNVFFNYSLILSHHILLIVSVCNLYRKCHFECPMGEKLQFCTIATIEFTRDIQCGKWKGNFSEPHCTTVWNWSWLCEWFEWHDCVRLHTIRVGQGSGTMGRIHCESPWVGQWKCTSSRNISKTSQPDPTYEGWWEWTRNYFSRRRRFANRSGRKTRNFEFNLSYGEWKHFTIGKAFVQNVCSIVANYSSRSDGN